MSLVINVSYDSSVENAPNGFKQTVSAAVAYVESQFATPIAITIGVGYGEIQGRQMQAAEGESASSSFATTYQQIRSALQQRSATADELTAGASLPATDPTHGAQLFVRYAEAEALGLSSGPPPGEFAGSIGLASVYPWTFGNPSEVTPGTYDLFAVVVHEITEVMGRGERLGDPTYGGRYLPMDLFRYAAPGVRQLAQGPGYFSINGSDLLAQFNDPTQGGDAGDWASSVPADAFDSRLPPGIVEAVSTTDLRVMDVLGYTPYATPDGPPRLNSSPPFGFSAFDTTTGEMAASAVETYTGPVGGLDEQYVTVTSDDLNVSVNSDNWFIHTGSGTDAISVRGGTNVLDGGTGSNFLSGGSGVDTFFVDDRSPAADLWSTVVGFHAGDAATIWGVTPQDFTLNWADNEGASGYTGLTLHATAAGKPTASLTLVGYSQLDLNRGRISLQFGTDASSGSAYMYVHANS